MFSVSLLLLEYLLASLFGGICARTNLSLSLSVSVSVSVSLSVCLFVCVCVCAVSYTHLTLPTNIAV